MSSNMEKEQRISELQAEYDEMTAKLNSHTRERHTLTSENHNLKLYVATLIAVFGIMC